MLIYISLGEVYMEQGVVVEPVRGNEKEYIIKDESGINSGRVYIIELSEENKFCSLRLKFYKTGEDGYKTLKKSLEVLLKSLFKNMKLNKISIYVDEDMEIEAFVDSGFGLEGVIMSSIIINSKEKYELIFGLEINMYNKEKVIKENRIFGERVHLSILTPKNAKEVLQYYINNKEHLEKFEPQREKNFFTLGAQKKSLSEGYRQYLNGQSVNFGIYINNKLIGKIQISNIIVGVFKSAFAGYSIDKEEEGKGYMREAFSLALTYCFNELGLHRIEASTLVDNIKSQNVLIKCGFKQLGVNQKYLFIDNKWRDHVTFYLINNI